MDFRGSRLHAADEDRDASRAPRPTCPCPFSTALGRGGGGARRHVTVTAVAGTSGALAVPAHPEHFTLVLISQARLAQLAQEQG